MQDYYMQVKCLKDIPWNFLIGDDGNIYEGRGFQYQGGCQTNFIPTSDSFDDVGLLIAFIGDYSVNTPSLRQIEAFTAFLSSSVNRDLLHKNYVINYGLLICLQ